MHSDEYDTDASYSGTSDSDTDDDVSGGAAAAGANNSANGVRQRQRPVSSSVTEDVFRNEVEYGEVHNSVGNSVGIGATAGID